jgi:hypothetical protein
MIAVLVLTTCGSNGVSTADDADDKAREEIKLLLPEATAMTKADLTLMSRADQVAVSIDHIKNQSLTLWVAGSKKAHKSDRIIKDNLELFIPAFAKEVLNNKPSTLFQAASIKSLTCTVKEDTARGTFTFKEGPLSGAFGYVAKRINGKWELVEFTCPKSEVKTIRQENGLWKMKE